MTPHAFPFVEGIDQLALLMIFRLYVFARVLRDHHPLYTHRREVWKEPRYVVPYQQCVLLIFTHRLLYCHNEGMFNTMMAVRATFKERIQHPPFLGYTTHWSHVPCCRVKVHIIRMRNGRNRPPRRKSEAYFRWVGNDSLTFCKIWELQCWLFYYLLLLLIRTLGTWLIEVLLLIEIGFNGFTYVYLSYNITNDTTARIDTVTRQRHNCNIINE